MLAGIIGERTSTMGAATGGDGKSMAHVEATETDSATLPTRCARRGTDWLAGMLAPVSSRSTNKKAGSTLLRETRHLQPHQSEIGRGEVIRTLDPLHPMQVRYQAAPRPDRGEA